MSQPFLIFYNFLTIFDVNWCRNLTPKDLTLTFEPFDCLNQSEDRCHL